jgi:hypothetical protein
MNCEATTEWERQSVWLVRFRQRKDKQGHTLSFRGGSAVHLARLKGRAWIATNSAALMCWYWLESKKPAGVGLP